MSTEGVRRSWSDLPPELLSKIADSLGLIELVSFRGVCKDWNSASSTASAQVESLSDEPWFLMYGENSECVLLSNLGTKYIMDIPEMDGATCLASYQGWLLVFNKGSMFFFCPFSRAKIDLPMFPYKELSDHFAAFSSPPTSKDCIVTVTSRCSELELELNLLRCGENEWSKHNFDCQRDRFDTIKSAVYHAGQFKFLDCKKGFVTFSAQDQTWKIYTIIEIRVQKNTPRCELLRFQKYGSYFERESMRKKLGMEEDFSISTCGTLINKVHGDDIIILNESIKFDSESCCLKGVWIQPRFFQISPNLSWSLEEA